MFRQYSVVILILLAVALFASSASAQTDNLPSLFPRTPEETQKINEMLVKQQAERDKKEHEELLKRGAEALELSNQLEKSFETNKSLTRDDVRKLESLEKLVTKIRNGLGGDDDKEDVQKEGSPGTLSLNDAFRYLQSTTVQLVDELKKTTRFSISAVAIQTSNTVIRLARLLRLRK
jgi:hypothetical protein